MNEKDVERLLRGAFDEQAQAYVDDQRTPPPPQFAQHGAQGKRRRTHLLAPLAAAAAVIAVVLGVTLGLTAGNHSRPDRTLALPNRATPHGSPHNSPHTQSPTTPRSSPAAGRAVRIRLATPGGRTYGVGLPVVAYFSRQFPDAHGLNAATTVTADGVRLPASWYFERSSSQPGYPVEGHLRPRNFWPADAQVTVAVPARGLAAGPGYSFSDGIHLTFRTGPRQIALVDDSTHRLTLTRNGHAVGSYPVSLGSQATPTMGGVKVVMSRQSPRCVSGPTYHVCDIHYAQQLSYTGEYLLAAPWNRTNIEQGVDSSSGCTNLLPADARKLYRTMRIGDVVEYPDATGPKMAPQLGFGDWNVPWRVWRTGGLIPTR